MRVPITFMQTERKCNTHLNDTALNPHSSNKNETCACVYKHGVYFPTCEIEAIERKGPKPFYKTELRTNGAPHGCTCYGASAGDDSSPKPLQRPRLETLQAARAPATPPPASQAGSSDGPGAALPSCFLRHVGQRWPGIIRD